MSRSNKGFLERWSANNRIHQTRNIRTPRGSILRIVLTSGVKYETETCLHQQIPDQVVAVESRTIFRADSEVVEVDSVFVCENQSSMMQSKWRYSLYLMPNGLSSGQKCYLEWMPWGMQHTYSDDFISVLMNSQVWPFQSDWKKHWPCRHQTLCMFKIRITGRWQCGRKLGLQITFKLWIC